MEATFLVEEKAYLAEAFLAFLQHFITDHLMTKRREERNERINVPSPGGKTGGLGGIDADICAATAI